MTPAKAAGVMIALSMLTACARAAPTAHSPHPATPFAAPFNLAVQPSGQKGRTASCPAPPQPPVLDFTGYYRPGSASSAVDPEAHRRYKDATKPIVRFENTITRLSDTYLQSARTERAAAQCVLTWLDAWAQKDAMLTATTAQGAYVRKWGLAPIAASFIKINGEPTLDPKTARTVAAWITRWANIVRTEYDTDQRRTSRRNNHLNWAALGVMWAGVGLDDRSLFDWSIGKYRTAIDQIQPDGTLPLELERRSKARHYHLFALAPLIFIAETGLRNGTDLYAENGGALHRLVDRIMTGLNDDSFFKRKTGHKQTRNGPLTGGKMTWMEPYYARFGDKRLLPWLNRFRPLKNRRTGGNATLLYAAGDG